MRYIAIRLLAIVPILFGISVLTFLVVQMVPGDPIVAMIGLEATDEAIDTLRARYGLDQPLPIQYIRWLGNVLQGDLGRSIQTGRPVATMLGDAVGPTVQLAGAALIISLIIAIPAGILSAVRRNGPTDFVVSLVALFGLSVPSFWLGIMLILALSISFPIFPSSGYVAFMDDPWGHLKTLLLPAITLGTSLAAATMRMTRSAMLEVLSQDYIRTAWAKGLSPMAVITRHAFRTALMPVVTLLGIQMGQVLGGVVITETVFSWPGIGKLTVDAIFARDYPVVQGAVLMTATAFVLINLLTDLVYAVLDPRAVEFGMSLSSPPQPTSDTDQTPTPAMPGRPTRISTLGAVLREPRAALGLAVLVVIALMAILGPWLYPYDPIKPDYLSTLAPPSWQHPFGTDDLGRDILARIIAGARISLLVGCVSVGSSIVLGTTVGILAGFYGGWISMGLMRVMDVLFAFPPVLLALGITAALGPSLTNAMLAISVVYLPIFARLARAQTLVVKEQTYTESDRAMGFSDFAIMVHAILPNIMAPLIVQASLLFGDAIITESYLSFLGLGTQPPNPSWGAMLKNAIGFLTLAPWMAWFPGLAIFVAVLGLNLVGDGLRDRLDPRLRKSM